MMNAWLGQRCRGIEAKIEHVHKPKQNLRDDLGTSSSAYGDDRFAILQNDGRAHAGERPFSGLDRVGFSANQAEKVWNSGLSREIIHFIVHDDARARDNDL